MTDDVSGAACVTPAKQNSIARLRLGGAGSLLKSPEGFVDRRASVSAPVVGQVVGAPRVHPHKHYADYPSQKDRGFARGVREGNIFRWRSAMRTLLGGGKP